MCPFPSPSSPIPSQAIQNHVGVGDVRQGLRNRDPREISVCNMSAVIQLAGSNQRRTVHRSARLTGPVRHRPAGENSFLVLFRSRERSGWSFSGSLTFGTCASPRISDVRFGRQDPLPRNKRRREMPPSFVRKEDTHQPQNPMVLL